MAEVFIAIVTTVSLVICIFASVAGGVHQLAGDRLPPIFATVAGLTGMIAGAGFCVAASLGP